MEMIQKKRNECANLVRISSRKINEIRFGENEGFLHKLTKQKICEQLKKENKHYICEAIFNNGNRTDILVLDDFRAIEIAVSETDASLKRKGNIYPNQLKLEVIRYGNERSRL